VATAAAAGDILSENTNSLNSIFKFEQYSISGIFKFQNSVTQHFNTNNSRSLTAQLIADKGRGTTRRHQQAMFYLKC